MDIIPPPFVFLCHCERSEAISWDCRTCSKIVLRLLRLTLSTEAMTILFHSLHQSSFKILSTTSTHSLGQAFVASARTDAVASM